MATHSSSPSSAREMVTRSPSGGADAFHAEPLSSQYQVQTIKNSGSRVIRRQTKNYFAAKSKPISDDSATRFQCPRCPKSFSRIENLTRHQANHEEVGKFACSFCKKRFTRSDLLNRHRRIHGPQSDAKRLQNLSDFVSVSVSTFASASASPHCGNSDSIPGKGPDSYTAQETPKFSTHISQGSHASHTCPLYQDISSATLHHQSIVDHHQIMTRYNQNQGLNSLMQAPLVSQQTFSFAPAEIINPLMWDGFMPLQDTNSDYMGAYDADMSWTLDYLQSKASSGFFLDQDMSNTYDELVDSAYQYQQLHYEQQPQLPPPPTTQHIEDIDGVNEDTDDWPDKVDEQIAPRRAIHRVVPVQSPTVSWESVLEEARASGLSAATIAPVQTFGAVLREPLLATINTGNLGNNPVHPEITDVMFPPGEVLDFFLRLYVLYIQPRFPVVHLPTFDIYNISPGLLLSMMFLGSSHSKMDRGRFACLFHERLRHSVICMQELDRNFMRNTDNVLLYFLLCLAGAWSGSKHSYEFAESGRGILVTACRRNRLLDCRPAANGGDQMKSSLDAIWRAWIEREKRKRLGLCIYCFDCQYPALFNNQPYVSKAETTNCAFPCPEEYWESPNADAWKMLVGTADTPGSTYCLHALNCCLLRKWVKPPLPIAKTGEFGKIILMYALHTHIFEWRQSTSMLNPTGLRGSFGSGAIDMGEGLRERRRWLVDGLDSFRECYQAPGTSVAAVLLNRLGYISLDVSLSDMHLMAGRSTHSHDTDFASENLKHWANSEISDSTMSNVYTMLELCYAQIDAGTVAHSSFEVSVALFTGGIICWAFAKLRVGALRDQYVEQVRRTSQCLRRMGCWGMCTIFGRILSSFEASSA